MRYLIWNIAIYGAVNSVWGEQKRALRRMRCHATVIEQAKIAGGNSAHVYKFELASLTVLLDEPTPPRIDELGVPPLLTRRPRACSTGSV